VKEKPGVLALVSCGCNRETGLERNQIRLLDTDKIVFVVNVLFHGEMRKVGE
jgi:hypothetical protein